MGIVYRNKKGSALSYNEMDANFATLSDATGSSVTGSFISGVTQTFQRGDGTSFTTTIASASYAVSASHVEFADLAASATSATSATTATTATNALAVSGSVQAVTFDSSGSFSISGSSVTFSGLSTNEPSTVGSLWLSGSGAGAASGSKYLMVFTG